MDDVIPPRIEGTIRLADQRRMSFAEFGPPQGRAVVWLHGTPGARRQIPNEARAYAEEQGVRIVGLDRPGVGHSTPHLYDQVADFTTDLAVLFERLEIDDVAMIGLSGGGPYALAAGARLPQVHSVGVLGGVAPTVGPNAIGGGLVALARFGGPVLPAIREPLGRVLSLLLQASRPVGSSALDLYARLSPPGDRTLLNRPEFKAMFLDDLLNGSRRHMSAVLSDAILFTRPWGFEPDEVEVPVRWWHGDADHIVPFAHGQHVVRRLPDATLKVLSGESHLGGLAVGTEVLDTLLELGTKRTSRSGRKRASKRTATGERLEVVDPE